MRSDLIILAAYAGTIAILAAIGFVMLDRHMAEEQAIRDCIAAIPNDLDADEIRYQEQECEMGWHP